MRSCEVPVDGFGTLVVALGLLETAGGVTRSSGPPVLGKSGRLRRIRSSSRPCQTAVNSEQTRGHVSGCSLRHPHTPRRYFPYTVICPTIKHQIPGLELSCLEWRWAAFRTRQLVPSRHLVCRVVRNRLFAFLRQVRLVYTFGLVADTVCALRARLETRLAGLAAARL